MVAYRFYTRRLKARWIDRRASIVKWLAHPQEFQAPLPNTARSQGPPKAGREGELMAKYLRLGLAFFALPISLIAGPSVAQETPLSSTLQTCGGSSCDDPNMLSLRSSYLNADDEAVREFITDAVLRNTIDGVTDWQTALYQFQSWYYSAEQRHIRDIRDNNGRFARSEQAIIAQVQRQARGEQVRREENRRALRSETRSAAEQEREDRVWEVLGRFGIGLALGGLSGGASAVLGLESQPQPPTSAAPQPPISQTIRLPDGTQIICTTVGGYTQCR